MTHSEAVTVIENARAGLRHWNVAVHGPHYRVAVYPKLTSYRLDEGLAPTCLKIDAVEFALEPDAIVGRYGGHEVRWWRPA